MTRIEYKCNRVLQIYKFFYNFLLPMIVSRFLVIYLPTLWSCEFEVYDRLSDEYVKQILGQVGEVEREELVGSMRRIGEILGNVKL